jgi:hypothetical protein
VQEEYKLRALNKVPIKILGPRRDEVTDWKTLCTEKLHNLQFSPNTFRVIKPRKMKGLEIEPT